MAKQPLRERTANAILALLGGKTEGSQSEMEGQQPEEVAQPFGEKERSMVSGVLTLGERTVRSIMTPRNGIDWLDLTLDFEGIKQQLTAMRHSYFPVCEGNLDRFKGIARAQDVVNDIFSLGVVQPHNIHYAVMLSETVGVLKAIDIFKKERIQMALVIDEYGSIEGLVTPIDVLEAIAGEFPDGEETPEIQETGKGVWKVHGTTDLYSIEQALGENGLVEDAQEYDTVTGLVLERLGIVPTVGQSFVHRGFRFEVTGMEDHRIKTIQITRLAGKPSD